MKMNKFRLAFVVISATYFFMACVGLGIDLDDKATKVPLWKADSGDHKAELESYEKLKYVKCEVGANGRSAFSNEKACENYLRNEAVRLGAEIVWVDESHHRGASDYFGKSCNNCVVVGGWTYKKKTPQSEQQKVESAGSDGGKAAEVLGPVSENSALDEGANEPFRLDLEKKPKADSPASIAAPSKAASPEGELDLDREPSAEKK